MRGKLVAPLAVACASAASFAPVPVATACAIGVNNGAVLLMCELWIFARALSDKQVSVKNSSKLVALPTHFMLRVACSVDEER